jgi:outer membrane immunogenic protein
MRSQKLNMLLAAAALCGLASRAQAADLGGAPQPQYKAAAVPAAIVSSWTGLYVGGQAGYGWGNFSASGPANFNFSQNANGGLYGGFAGVNWVVPGTNFLVGAELDAMGANESMTLAGIGTGTENLIATARMRVGLTFGDWLFYLTGGGAYGNGQATPFGTNIAFNSPGIGWTIGGGVDYAVTAISPHLFVGALYKYTSLNGDSDSAGDSSKFTDNELLGRVGWRF